MRFISEQRLDYGVLERDFTLGEIPGVLWTPGCAPAPLILMGHNGGLHKRDPRLVARARHVPPRLPLPLHAKPKPCQNLLVQYSRAARVAVCRMAFRGRRTPTHTPTRLPFATEY